MGLAGYPVGLNLTYPIGVICKDLSRGLVIVTSETILAQSFYLYLAGHCCHCEHSDADSADGQLISLARSTPRARRWCSRRSKADSNNKPPSIAKAISTPRKVVVPSGSQASRLSSLSGRRPNTREHFGEFGFLASWVEDLRSP